MRDYIFHGKCTITDKWVEGFLNYSDARKQYYIMDKVDAFPIPVYEESVGQYTGMNEFVVSDRSYNKPLFEGDIVEIWGWRSPKYTYNAQSQYDGYVKCRAVIYFEHGEWRLDYKNKYNEAHSKLKGKEVDDREVGCQRELHQYGSCNEEFDREYNQDYLLRDIVKIGNVFENADLLEG
jgi:hypothetical protein